MFWDHLPGMTNFKTSFIKFLTTNNIQTIRNSAFYYYQIAKKDHFSETHIIYKGSEMNCISMY